MAKQTKKQEMKKARPAHVPNPFEEMERMFDQYLHGGWLHPWSVFREAALPDIRFPKVDVVDREDEVVVKAEIPGVDKKDINVTVGDDSVTIKGATCHEQKEEDGDYYRCEISRGSFSRNVALPARVDGSRARADFRDGMLELTLPKVASAKRHTIKVD